MALYRNLLTSRLILSNNHVANPTGSKSFDGHPTDLVEISDADLELPGIKIMLSQDPPALELYKAPTAAEAKAALKADAKSDDKVEDKVETKAEEKTPPKSEAPKADKK